MDRWKQNVQSWKALFQIVGKKEAKDSRRMENELYNKLINVEATIQWEPYNERATKFVRVTKDELRFLQGVRIQGVKVRSIINWLDQGDKGSNFFFHLLRMKQAKVNIDSICDDGLDISDQEGILQAFMNYYRRLFTTKDEGGNKELDRQ